MTMDRGLRLEFWPDYGGTLLWESGQQIALQDLPLPPQLVATATDWLADYDDAKLPWEPTHDDTWLAVGRQLFESLRDALWEHGIELVAGEDHWRS